MSYLHCHTKDCSFSQDDFYSKSYNPFTKIWSDIKWLITPKFLKMDFGWIQTMGEISAYTHVPLLKIKSRCFSWNLLIVEIVKDLKVALEMKWYTYEAWKKDYDGGAVCPKCGKRNFDID